MGHPVYKRVNGGEFDRNSERELLLAQFALVRPCAKSRFASPWRCSPPERHPSLPTSFSPGLYAVFIVIRVFQREIKKFVIKITFVSRKRKKVIKVESDLRIIYFWSKSSNLSWMDNYDDDEISLDAVNIIVADIRMHSRFVIYKFMIYCTIYI